MKRVKKKRAILLRPERTLEGLREGHGSIKIYRRLKFGQVDGGMVRGSGVCRNTVASPGVELWAKGD